MRVEFIHVQRGAEVRAEEFTRGAGGVDSGVEKWSHGAGMMGGKETGGEMNSPPVSD